MNDIFMFIAILMTSLACSTALFIYLHYKTRIDRRYLYFNNACIAFFSAIIAFLLIKYVFSFSLMPIITVLTVLCVLFLYIMACFWRTPRRKTGVGSGLILSPADGKIIYIKKIDTGGIPVSLKDGKKSYLEELRKTYLLNMSLWHIGINMTLLDAHKNCAPISGKIIMNQHFPGKFLSLKNKNSQTENERNTYVIQNGELRVGIVQIASRIVRRIDSYVKQGESVGMGDWIGMIRFGSQVDIIVPSFCEIIVNPGEQVYAGITVLAKYTPAENTKTQAQRIDD